MSDTSGMRNTLIALGAVSCTIIGGLYNLTIVPMSNKIDYQSVQINELEKRLYAMQTQNQETAIHIDYIKKNMERFIEATNE